MVQYSDYHKTRDSLLEKVNPGSLYIYTIPNLSDSIRDIEVYLGVSLKPLPLKSSPIHDEIFGGLKTLFPNLRKASVYYGDLSKKGVGGYCFSGKIIVVDQRDVEGFKSEFGETDGRTFLFINDGDQRLRRRLAHEYGHVIFNKYYEFSIIDVGTKNKIFTKANNRFVRSVNEGFSFWLAKEYIERFVKGQEIPLPTSEELSIYSDEANPDLIEYIGWRLRDASRTKGIEGVIENFDGIISYCIDEIVSGNYLLISVEDLRRSN